MNLNRLRDSDLLFQGLREFLESWIPDSAEEEAPPFLDRIPEGLKKSPSPFADYSRILTDFPYLDWTHSEGAWPYSTERADEYIFVVDATWDSWKVVCSIQESDFGSLFHLDDYDMNFEVSDFPESLQEFLVLVYLRDLIHSFGSLYGKPEGLRRNSIDNDADLIYSSMYPTKGAAVHDEYDIFLYPDNSLVGRFRSKGFIEAATIQPPA